ncbi:MAG: nusA [Phycisphaerales bacterium]|nr:nusA [Phycisphaerales bacterium]
MPNPELIRIVDGIARDKNIERDQVYADIEQAIASGLRKHYNTEDTAEFGVTLDKVSGDVSVSRNGDTVPLSVMGRIGAQTVKQVMIQLIRQDERGAIYEEYKDRVGTIVTGTITRFEGPMMIVNLGRVEGIMPRSEQIPGEQHEPGERVQALIMEVRDTPSAIKIILSRSHPELIRRLFEREVPEVGERTIEIKALAREPGHRTKIAVSSIDTKVDAVGACVGVRGSRIKNIVEELGGEKIDIVRWNESSQILISNALKPAEVTEVSLCFELGRGTVIVNEDQLSLAIGKRGQNVRLAARLTGWDIDILTPTEFQKGTARVQETLTSIEGVSQDMVDKVIAMGLIDVRDVEEVGADPLMEELQMTEELATAVVERCGEAAKLVAIEAEAKKQADARAKAEAAAALRGLDGLAIPAAQPTDPAVAAALAAETDTPAANADAETADPERMPGAMEASEGGSPEVTVHKIDPTAGDDAELSPEEQAIHGVTQDGAEEGPTQDDDEAQAAAEPPRDASEDDGAPADKAGPVAEPA